MCGFSVVFSADRQDNDGDLFCRSTLMCGPGRCARKGGGSMLSYRNGILPGGWLKISSSAGRTAVLGISFGLVVAIATVASAQGVPEVFGTGLKDETPEGQAWLKKHCPPVRQIKLNTLALQRINKARRTGGQSELSAVDIGAVPVGQEAVLESAPDAGITSIPDPGVVPMAGTFLDNSTEIWFPPIRSQGSIGSCVCWGITYYTLTYEVCRLKGWNAKSGDNTLIFSPKWTYNMINGGTDAGSSMSDAFGVQMSHGAAKWSAYPYDSDYRGWCMTPTAWRDAIRWRMANYYSISSMNTSTGIQNLKNNLLNGYICPFATYVTSWQYTTVGNDPATTNDDSFVGQRICNYMNGTAGAHIMTFVGYNDDIWCDINNNGAVDTGEKGAFKLANSWGTGDWNSGYRWVSYDAFYTTSQVTGANQPGRLMLLQSTGACYYEVVQDHPVKLYGKFTVNHALRNQMQMRLGMSASGAASPSQYFTPYGLTYDGGGYAFNGGSTAVDGTFYLDFSDLNPANGQNYRFWALGYDNAAGSPLTLKSFSVVDTWGSERSATNFSPANGVADGGAEVRSWIDMTYTILPPESNVVGVTVGDSICAELGTNTGTFVFTRRDPVTGNGTTSGDMTVVFSVSGTALQGTDYVTVGTNVLIPAGSSNAVVTIAPVQDTAVEGTETVMLTLAPVSGTYFVQDGAVNATLNLTDDDSRITIAATDAVAAETGGNNGVLTATRSGGTDGSLRIYYSRDPASTAATNDYAALSGYLDIADKQSSGTITVTPVNDTTPELDEAVMLRVDASAAYVVGSPSNASVTILANDNAAPVVNITWPVSSYVTVSGTTARLLLEASATDDGNPSGVLTTSWSQVSGPTGVTFGSTSATNTTLYIPTTGTFVVRLTANDGWAQSWDELTVNVDTNAQMGGGPMDNLVLWHKLNEAAGTTAADSSGSTNTGTVIGGATWTPGRVDGGLNCDGVDDGVTVAAVAGFAAGNTPHTISAWIKVNALPSNRAWIALLGNEANGSHHWLINNSGTTQFGLWGGGQLAPPLVVGQWKHVVMTFDGTTLRGYVDGVTNGSVAATFNFAGVPFTVARQHNSENYFNGTVDDVRIYKRGLSAAEVLQIYNQKSNYAPAVDAGPDVETSNVMPAPLAGVVADDGMPNPPGVVSSMWQKVSGPGAVGFADASQPATTASSVTPGEYTLRLVGNDGSVKCYDDLNMAVVQAIPGLTLSETDGQTEVREHGGGMSDQVLLRLNTQPTGAVSVALSYDSSQIGVTPVVLNFATSNWAVAQTCTVTAIDDSLPEGLSTRQITFTASSLDTNYSGSATSVVVRILDNDVNNMPEAQNDTLSTVEDSPAAAVAVLVNDGDIDGDTLAVASVIQPAHGVAAIPAGCTNVTYRPLANYNGDDSFAYVVSDGRGGLATGTVSVTVAGVNDSPAANDDGVTVNEDGTAVYCNVLANDSDGDGDTLTVISAVQPAHGTVSIIGGTNITYQPSANYGGTDSFTYTIGDGKAATAVATVLVTVNGVNDAPSAQAQSVATSENQPVAIKLAATDIDGDSLSYSVVTWPSHGSLSGSAPNLVYAPAPGYTGQDGFSFKANDGKVDSVSASVTITMADKINIRINFQPDASATPSNFLADSGGAFALRGGYSYGWGGDNTANTWDCDSGSSPDQAYDTGIFMNNPNTVNEPWEIELPSDSYRVHLVAGDPSQAQSTTYHVLGEGSAILAEGTVVAGWVEGTSTVSVTDGRLSLTSGVNATRKRNAICFVEISNQTNAAPVVEAGGDVAVCTNVVSLAGAVADDGLPVASTVTQYWVKVTGPGTVTFGNSNAPATTATFGTYGTYLLRLTGSDTAFLASDTVSVTVTSRPSASVVGVDANASETGGDPGVVSVRLWPPPGVSVTVNYSVGGTATQGGDFTNLSGQVTFSGGQTNKLITITPVNDSVLNEGDETVTITLQAAAGYELKSPTSGTVTIHDNDFNSAPSAGNDTVTTDEDLVTAVDVLANDTDANGDTLTVQSVGAAGHGTTQNGGTLVVYQPAANYNGADSFSYVISDGRGGLATGTVSLAVTSINDPPTCSISSPSSGAGFAAGQSIEIVSSCTDVDGLVTQVVFWADSTNRLGTVYGYPASFTWSNAAAGAHVLTLVCTDNSGGVGVSPGVLANVACDSDGDGMTDADELVAGTDPGSASSVFRFNALSITNSRDMTLYLLTVTGRTYNVDWKTNLVSGWFPLASNLSGVSGYLTIPDTNNAPMRLYRARVK
ncbi:MAG: hypothetical protein C0404_08020 [Verrucomicrobia bacterium]|nr:hypothetical protein [Verrucomicrobiota bacterium]